MREERNVADNGYKYQLPLLVLCFNDSLCCSFCATDLLLITLLISAINYMTFYVGRLAVLRILPVLGWLLKHALFSTFPQCFCLCLSELAPERYSAMRYATRDICFHRYGFTSCPKKFRKAISYLALEARFLSLE